MARIPYTDEQKGEFVELAQEMGMAPAMRELQYPNSKTTAMTWLRDSGVEITVDDLQRRAALMHHYYGASELLVGLQEAFLVSMDLLESGDVDAGDLDKITKSQERLAKTIQLLTGGATSRTGVERTELPPELLKLVRQQEEMNAQRELSIADAEIIED